MSKVECGMSNYQSIFERYELKYMLDQTQKEAVMAAVSEHMRPDEYGRSTVCNLYFDTPDFRLIRHSIEKPVYKEKLRLRSYGRATEEGNVFLELKKKYKGVVYKRRIDMPERDATNYLSGFGLQRPPTQIIREIDYCVSLYKNLAPAVYISYEREAYYGKDDPELRITFDEDLLWRNTDLDLTSEVYGYPLLEPGQTIMEVKIPGSMPLWLSRSLCTNRIYRSSFSKYGEAYRTIRLGGPALSKPVAGVEAI